MEEGVKSMNGPSGQKGNWLRCEKMAWLWVMPHCQEGELIKKKWATQKESGRPWHRTGGMWLLENRRKVRNGQPQASQSAHTERGVK